MKAIIDLGTNTFHLMIASVAGGVLTVHSKLQIAVKIGECGITSGVISEAAYQRGIDALSKFREEINKCEVTEVLAFGTSAIRDASNGGEFIRESKAKFDIDITAISGEDEASYIYDGVLHSFAFPDYPVLVMDIGGGSVEFIIGRRENILFKSSFRVGAARLLEKFCHSEPIRENEIQAIEGFLYEMLKELGAALEKFPVTMMIGSAGAFETLRDVIVEDINGTIASLGENACEIKLADVERFYQLMILMNEHERRALRGMVDFRVDMIVVSAILMRFVIQLALIKKLIVSEYALKEGIIYGLA